MHAPGGPVLKAESPTMAFDLPTLSSATESSRPASVPRQHGPSGQTSDPLAGRRIAILNEWFERTGGAERVLVATRKCLPGADAYALWSDVDDDPSLRESWLARTPLRGRKALTLPLMPLVWRTQTRQRYDVVLSLSHSLNHTARFPLRPGGVHLAYVHTPARYLWLPELDARRRRGLSQRAAVATTKWLEARTSRHVDAYAANSAEVRERIARFWRRDCVVIHPPARTEFFSAPPAPDRAQSRDYVMGVGRWVEYKRFDLMIEIAERAGLPLVLAGAGPMEGELRRLAARARVPVTFHLRPNDECLRALLWGARCVLFPGHEDFGIVPVEAQACGTPVVGLRRGGLLETVRDGETGHLVEDLTIDRFADRVRAVHELSPAAAQANASRFSEAAFQARLLSWVGEHLTPGADPGYTSR